MERPAIGVFLPPPPSPLDGILVYRNVSPSIKFADTRLYTWVKRGTAKVKCHKRSLRLDCVPLGWSGSGSVIQDHSDHDASKEPMNPLWSRIHRFLWCTMIWVILGHWSWSRSPQRNASKWCCNYGITHMPNHWVGTCCCQFRDTIGYHSRIF